MYGNVGMSANTGIVVASGATTAAATQNAWLGLTAVAVMAISMGAYGLTSRLRRRGANQRP